MIQPNELRQTLSVELSNGIVSTTTAVWEVLTASRDGRLFRVKELAAGCPELIYAQYNYAPPIHFAVREGHIELVEYLLDQGACDPSYKTYPFLDSLLTVAEDRGHTEIARSLLRYDGDAARWKFKGDNGRIVRERSVPEKELQQLIQLLMSYGARVPDILKWAQFYYFEKYETAAF